MSVGRTATTISLLLVDYRVKAYHHGLSLGFLRMAVDGKAAFTWKETRLSWGGVAVTDAF